MKDLLDPYLGIIKAAIIIAAILGIFYAGMRFNESKWLKKQADAVNQARATESDLQDKANQWTSDYINRLQNQLKAAHALPKVTLDHDCPVPAAVGGLLNDAQRMPEDAGTGSSSRSASETVDSTCAAELEIAKRNYAEVCIPNAQHLTELRDRWKKTREIVNEN
tara:strand:+ start:463944 stop:464438 length:495 start_codon:yes stop_codon:yes gene_type:complete